jgi:hypothetical protein
MILICCGIGITVRGFLVEVGWFWPVGCAVFAAVAVPGICVWIGRCESHVLLVFKIGFLTTETHFGVVTSPYYWFGLLRQAVDPVKKVRGAIRRGV